MKGASWPNPCSPIASQARRPLPYIARCLDLGGCPRLLMGGASLQQPLLFTTVVVTQASFAPALSGGKGRKGGGFCFLWQGLGWVARESG